MVGSHQYVGQDSSRHVYRDGKFDGQVLTCELLIAHSGSCSALPRIH